MNDGPAGFPFGDFSFKLPMGGMPVMGAGDAAGRIFSIAEKVVVFEGLEGLLDHIAGTAKELAQADAVSIWIADYPSGAPRLLKGIGLGREFLARRSEALSAGFVDRLLKGNPPCSGDRDAATRGCDDPDLLRAEGFRAFLCLPLLSPGSAPVGCLTVYRREDRPFSDEDRLLLRMFAGRAVEGLEQVREVEDLRRRAVLDALTGVLNKGALMKEAEAHVKLARRHGHPVGVVFLDLDDFKRFNDTHGHLLGDRLLADFAALVARNCRQTDVLGRFGGEEFILIAPHTDKRGAHALVEKLRRLVRAQDFPGRDGAVRVTFSAGVAVFPEDGGEAGTLLARADAAMLHAKRAGKDRVTLWSEACCSP